MPRYKVEVVKSTRSALAFYVKAADKAEAERLALDSAAVGGWEWNLDAEDLETGEVEEIDG